MKVFIHSDVLAEIADLACSSAPDNNPLSALVRTAAINLWTSPLAIADVLETSTGKHSTEHANTFLDFIEKNIAVVPLRFPVNDPEFTRKIKEGPGTLLDKIVTNSARTLGIDCIITRQADAFADSCMRVSTPELLLEDLANGKFVGDTVVPFLDLTVQHHSIYNEIDNRFTEIISHNGFILGKHVQEFEERFAELHNARYCIGVSSGTGALHVALLALDIGHGDGVIVPTNTFIATAEPVSMVGATPVFVDCDSYYNIDTTKVRELLENPKNMEDGPRIKAIAPVHLYGQPANMGEIMALADEFNLVVLEDCCQAHLATWQDRITGTIGSFGAYSFYPGKNLGAWGEGGALLTNDEALFEKAQMIRQHGEKQRYHHSLVGHNFRMEAFQGAVLATKLNYIEDWTQARKNNARLYNERLNDIDGIQTPRELDGTGCVYHLYVIQIDDRDGLRDYLQERGIASGLHYPVPLHLQMAYSELGYSAGSFPVAESAAKRILSLPMYPQLTEDQIDIVCNAISDFVSQKNK